MSDTDPFNLRTIDGAEKAIGMLIPMMRKHMEEDGYVADFTILFAERGRDGKPFPHAQAIMCMIPPPDDCEDAEVGKNYVRSVQDNLIRETNACGIAYVAEAWILTGDAAATSMLRGVRPSEHAQRQEIVAVSLDHVGGKTMWSIPIVREDGKPATLGEPEKRRHGKHDHGVGRFTDWLAHLRDPNVS